MWTEIETLRKHPEGGDGKTASAGESKNLPFLLFVKEIRSLPICCLSRCQVHGKQA